MPLWLKIVLCIVIAEILGGLGGFVTAGSIGGWYAALEKPPGNPPNWLFAPVWTVLYAMMGTSFALVWHESPKENEGAEAADPRLSGGDGWKRKALTWFVIQLVLNLVWTPIFFGAHRMLIALIVILSLLVAIVITIRIILQRQTVAGFLLVPYAIWVSYASYLNASYWWLNR